ncbi:alpha-D-ribose 1-methylphosphonate 5-triphosphate diphosphatase [Zafaria sp. J156]|uniref:alpha-D-ribose 1-methylphosphonate 5-triphosphate diphosphatase n=1 Tax=Zafaria sp. J156 TaxID=3116490 RepID=UPI002E793B5F|nr:alpha-D-ribose 1-methylphosphonate 5-triphosphate diphosphatase [Zafaria sp. J156]MEE1622912.1 alpha-D-ribose 1-methylphosphonate 5-triphosphate diphosphatase [Zafaria sp. J156]
MTTDLVFTNARIVLEREVLHGSLLVRDGRIADISAGPSERGIDLEGDILMPGGVELHTDHVEHHLRPRPGVHWEALPALLAHDAQMTAAGTTTVLDAIRLGSEPSNRESLARTARELANAITTASSAGLLRADHAIHLRCEVSAEDCSDRVEEFASHKDVRVISLMDHTPGQRQFEDVAEFRKYYLGKGIVGEGEIDAYIAGMIEQAALHSYRNRKNAAGIAAVRGITLAAHDDSTREQVEESAAFGVKIAEFPTTVAAAEASLEHGMLTVMGAPNIVRGGSQSGNVAAAELLKRGLLHILSSDYVLTPTENRAKNAN